MECSLHTFYYTFNYTAHRTLQCNTHCKTYTEYFCTLDTHQSIWVLHIEHWHNKTHWHTFLHTAHFTHRQTPDFLHTANAHLTNTRLAAQWSLNAQCSAVPRNAKAGSTKCVPEQCIARCCKDLKSHFATLCSIKMYKIYTTKLQKKNGVSEMELVVPESKKAKPLLYCSNFTGSTFWPF